MSEWARTLAEIEALKAAGRRLELMPIHPDDLDGREIAQFGAILVELYAYGRHGALRRGA